MENCNDSSKTQLSAILSLEFDPFFRLQDEQHDADRSLEFTEQTCHPLLSRWSHNSCSIFSVCFQHTKNDKEKNTYDGWPELITLTGCIPKYYGWYAAPSFIPLVVAASNRKMKHENLVDVGKPSLVKWSTWWASYIPVYQLGEKLGRIFRITVSITKTCR